MEFSIKCDSHEEKTRITERVWEALCGKRIKQPAALAVLFVLMFIGVCFFVKANQAKEFEKNDYGVFLNADASSLERFKMYETIVIDAQYFTKRDIELLHQNGTVVYTYLNIGSIENFREYYTTYTRNEQYKALALSVSDNMDGKVYAVVKKELDELMKLSNEYFDVRHNDYLNAAKEKREPLNDSQFIEYLYNRAYSILYLLRLKS